MSTDEQEGPSKFAGTDAEREIIKETTRKVKDLVGKIGAIGVLLLTDPENKELKQQHKQLLEEMLTLSHELSETTYAALISEESQPRDPSQVRQFLDDISYLLTHPRAFRMLGFEPVQHGTMQNVANILRWALGLSNDGGTTSLQTFTSREVRKIKNIFALEELAVAERKRQAEYHRQQAQPTEVHDEDRSGDEAAAT